MSNYTTEHFKISQYLHHTGLSQDVYTETLSISSPELQMWAICLIHGVHYAMNGDSRELAWCLSPNTKPGSFLFITTHLNLDPAAIIEQIYRKPHKFRNMPLPKTRFGRNYKRWVKKKKA